MSACFVEVYCLGAWVATEIVDGETLAAYLLRKGELPVGEAARILVALTDALLHAHQHGQIRLDLRPDNIMLLPNGAVLVVDWGIITVAGAANYSAPEELRGLATDGRADIYSLGIIAYQMLTGHPPFYGGSDFTVAIQHLHALPSSISAVRPDVPAALDALVRSMLSKDPEMRPWIERARQQLAALGQDDEVPEIEIGYAPSNGVAGEIVCPPYDL